MRVINIPKAIKIFNLFPDNISIGSDYDREKDRYSASIYERRDGKEVGKIFSLDHYIYRTPRAAAEGLEIEMMKAITAIKVMSN
jgi:hypothetical protein